MRKRLICCLLTICIFMSGCFSYSDIDKVLFVTSMIIDTQSDGQVVLYIEAFKPFRSSSKDSAKGQRITFKGTGKTIYEVMKDLNLSSSYKLNYTQNNIIIFSQNAAEQGLTDYFDVLSRDQELLIRPFVAVFTGDPQNLISAQIKEEEYIGVFLKELIQNQKNSARAVQMHLNEVLSHRLTPKRTSIVTAFKLNNNVGEQKLEVDGGAIIKDDKLAGIIKKSDGEKYNFLMNNVNSGTLEPANPMNENKFITMEILKSKTSTELTFDGKNILLKKKISTNTSITDVQGHVAFNDDERKKLKQNAESNIKKFCTDFFNEYKKKGIDIFEIQDEFQRKYPNENVNNAISITKLDLEVNVNIDDSQDTTDFR